MESRDIFLKRSILAIANDIKEVDEASFIALNECANRIEYLHNVYIAAIRANKTLKMLGASNEVAINEHLSLESVINEK